MPADSQLQNIFRELVRKRRKEMRLSQKQVADLLGISQPAYAEIESGRSGLTLKRVEQIANALQTTARDLLVMPEVEVV